MRTRPVDITVLPDRMCGIICLIIAIAMCVGAAAVSFGGGTTITRTYGAVLLTPPALGMLWIGLDLVTDLRLSRAWRRISGRG